MADQVFPTKGNLLNVKKSLSLAKVGYELLDRKRNVLIRELMMMVDAAKALRSSISETYKDAYNALQKANITMGLISRVAEGMPVEKSVNVTYRSVMGCELPKVTLDPPDSSIPYGFENTDGNVDVAYISFGRVKQMTAMLAEVDNSVFRLANAILFIGLPPLPCKAAQRSSQSSRCPRGRSVPLRYPRRSAPRFS